MRLAALFTLIVALPLGAQDLGVHTSTIVRRGTNELAHGFGVSLAGSFRVGDILADTALARKVGLRIGARVAVSETEYPGHMYGYCVDMCPGANDVSVRSRMTRVILFLLPVRMPSARIDVGGGFANNARTRLLADGSVYARDATWGFVASVAAAGRLRTSPLWIQLEYTLHAHPLEYPLDGHAETPGHSLNAGLVVRFSDLRRRGPTP